MTEADEPLLTPDERAELADLIDELPDVHPPNTAGRRLRLRHGLLPGSYWPSMARLTLIERAVSARRRRQCHTVPRCRAHARVGRS